MILIKMHETCKNKCCMIHTIPYQYEYKKYTDRDKYYRKKAGAIIYDDSGRYLLVQSRGEKWGFPKGTMEDNETIQECAIREVYEETGIVLTLEEIEKASTKRISRCTYYRIQRTYNPSLSIPDIEENDSTGIVWVYIDCLRRMVKENKMKLNSHCKQLLKIK